MLFYQLSYHDRAVKKIAELLLDLEKLNAIMSTTPINPFFKNNDYIDQIDKTQKLFKRS